MHLVVFFVRAMVAWLIDVVSTGAIAYGPSLVAINVLRPGAECRRGDLWAILIARTCVVLFPKLDAAPRRQALYVQLLAHARGRPLHVSGKNK